MCIHVFKKQAEKFQWVHYRLAVLQYFLKPKDAFVNVLQAIMCMYEM